MDQKSIVDSLPPSAFALWLYLVEWIRENPRIFSFRARRKLCCIDCGLSLTMHGSIDSFLCKLNNRQHELRCRVQCLRWEDKLREQIMKNWTEFSISLTTEIFFYFVVSALPSQFFIFILSASLDPHLFRGKQMFSFSFWLAFLLFVLLLSFRIDLPSHRVLNNETLIHSR